MDNLNIPLISPVALKYYEYACDDSERIHHRAEDVRICLEKICDSIIVQLVSSDTKRKWGNLKLHNKLESCKEFMNPEVVNKLLEAKGIGNKGVHDGEEGDFTKQDINDSLDTIKNFSLEVFFSYFVRNGFGDLMQGSWIPTVFSTLPPVYRIQVLEKYYAIEPSVFVIDKLSKAYLKNNMKNKAYAFLSDCHNKGQLSNFELDYFMESLKVLEPNLDKFSIARNLDEAKRNFLDLLPAIDENERDTFVILVSMILTGEQPSEICTD